MSVAATLVTVTTLVLVLFSVVSYLSDARIQWTTLRRLTNVQANALAEALALPVWNIDRGAVDKIIEAMAQPKSIYAITVDAAGQTHGRVRNAQWDLVPWDGDRMPADLISETRPIVFAGEQIGTARLYVSPRFVYSDLRASLMRIVGAIVALDILLIASTYFILWRMVVRPLVDIERYAVAVRTGDAATIAIDRRAPAELESLRASIETMVNLLGARYAELEELRRTEKMAAMGALVAGVAHEVRNPLFGMSAMMDAYAEELDRHDLAEFTAGLREQVARLTQLMTELLEFGKPVKMTTAPGNLRELVDEVIASRARAASDAGVTLRSAMNGDLPPLAMDRSRLRQVFENLVDNALQHVKSGGTVTVAADEKTQGGRRWIESRVEDSGPGFNPGDLPRLFEPFFTRRERGTGLGLSIVQRIVEEHGGRVAAGNREGGGAVVTVRLPAMG